MAILQRVRDLNVREYYSHPNVSVSGLFNSNLDMGRAIETLSPPTYQKTVFKLRMRLLKDTAEERYLRVARNEEAWLRDRLRSTMELEDSSGNKVSLEEIFLEDRFPKGLHHNEQFRFHPDHLLCELQQRGYHLYVVMENHRVRLINPLISRIDKRYTAPPMFNAYDTQYNYIELDIEILCDYVEDSPVCNAATIREAIKSILKKNLTLSILPSRQDVLAIHATLSENKARETLRDTLTEKEWRKYLTNGFVMVQGKSGKWYQIFVKQKHLRVYEHGKFIKELCIHTAATECPPTDHILNMKVMVECDEQSVWDGSNLYEPTKKIDRIIQEDTGNVFDLFKKLKQDKTFLEQKTRNLNGCIDYDQFGRLRNYA